jgi:hypothetical protein
LTNRIFLGLLLLAVIALFLDLALTGGAGLLFMARRFVDLVDWVAFWR